jgi:hypothetical protein
MGWVRPVMEILSNERETFYLKGKDESELLWC